MPCRQCLSVDFIAKRLLRGGKEERKKGGKRVKKKERGREKMANSKRRE